MAQCPANLSRFGFILLPFLAGTLASSFTIQLRGQPTRGIPLRRITAVLTQGFCLPAIVKCRSTDPSSIMFDAFS